MFGLGTPEILLLFGIFVLVPIIRGLIESAKAKKFKLLVFSLTFTETFGFILCISIIGIPLGILLIMQAQKEKVNIEIEKNTSQTNEILNSMLNKK